MRFAIAWLTLIPTLALAAEPSSLAIRNATVETLGSAGRLDRATVVIRDGKIAAVGKDVAIPDEAIVIDAAGGTLMPGLIDPYFEVSIAAPTQDAGPRTVVVRGRPVNLPGMPGARGGTFTRVADNFYPYDDGFKPLPRIGITKLNLVTNGSGQSAIVRATPDEPDRMLVKPDGIAFVSVTNSTESLDGVRQRLEAANRAKSSSSSRPSNAPQAAGAGMWAEVLDGKTPLVAEAANAAAVVHLLKAVEPHKNVKLVIFMTGDAVAETADALKGRNVTVILRPGIDVTPNTRDRFNPARMLHESGVDFAFSMTARPPGAAANRAAAAALGDSELEMGLEPDCPLFPVAMLVKTGLPRKTALEALGKRPAAIIGLGATHGTIEAGKAADLLLFTGDPLDPASRLQRTIIDGRTAYEN
jgi:imidazolonepropionase-like amidohydrolase